MPLLLILVVPVILFLGIAAVFVGVLGALLPFLAAHGFALASAVWFVALVKVLLLMMLVVMPTASMLTWMERKESAMMQDRRGPNRAAILGFRLAGIPHFIADAVKMIFKEDFVPEKASKVLFGLAPVLAIMPVFVTFAIIPFGGNICTGQLMNVVTDTQTCSDIVTMQVARLDVGMLFYFAIASLAVYGTTIAGWASYNKWSLLGGLRASSQMMSYEVTMGLAILGAFLVYGTLEPSAMVDQQGSNPLHWGIVSQPLAAILFFTAAIAETKRAPFDLPEGESEVIGYFVEYSGMRFGVFYLAEFIEVIFAATAMTTVFFGGWHLPGLHADGFHLGAAHLALPHVAVLILQTATFGLKMIFFCWFQLLIRWTLPRFRADQLMSFGWKQLLPASLVNIVITAGVILYRMGAH